ncbi:MAG: hypothetical protein OQK46_05715 [Gammaproteobacteria bacterium]|nr:hypothetical protein [Gammaproteobacteria bacterium]
MIETIISKSPNKHINTGNLALRPKKQAFGKFAGYVCVEDVEKPH